MATKMQQKFRNKIMESTILDSFTKLATDTDQERIEAGAQLLKHLSQTQDDDDQNENKEFKYTLDRLIRGVGSSRINARKGFYSALVALLSTYSISLENIKDVVQKQLQFNGTNKSDKADIYMGQILVVGALIRSKVFEGGTIGEQKELLNILITTGKKRSFLSLASYSFLISYLDTISANDFKTILWPLIQLEVLKSWVEQDINTIWFLLIASEKFPKIIKSKLLEKHLHSSEVISDDTVQYLYEILMNTSMSTSLQHPFYQLFATKIVSSNSLIKFCLIADSHLDKDKFNRNKFTNYLTLLNLILLEIEDISKIPDLLTCNLIQTAVKILAPMKNQKHDEINIKFNQLLSTVKNKLSDSNVKYEIKLKVIKLFLLDSEQFLFESITGTKIIQQLTSTLDSDGVRKLSKLYRDVITMKQLKSRKAEGENRWLNQERVQAATYLNKLLNHPAMHTEVEWKFKNIKLFLELSILRTAQSNVSVELANLLKETFYHSLDQKFPKLENLRIILLQLVQHINTNILENNSGEILPNECIEHWQKMLKFVKKIEKRENGSNFIIPIFHTLLLQMGLQLFLNKKLAMSTLDELFNCYKRAKKQDNQNTNNDENEPVWIEVMIDLFLSLLSRENHLYRKMINLVFPYLCKHLTPSALTQILNVLDPNKEENPLLENLNESENEEKEEEEEEGEQSSSDNESDLSDIDNYENEPVNDKLRMAIQNALGTVGGMDVDQESIDIDDIDEEDGKRLDVALEAAFRSVRGSRGKSTKQNKSEQILIHFRVRVLDLLEIYIDSEITLSTLLEIVKPLIQLLQFSIKNSHQKPLENRLRSFFNKLMKVKKIEVDEKCTEDVVVDFLKQIVDNSAVTAPIFKDTHDVLTKCFIFTIKMIKAHDEQFINLNIIVDFIQNCLCDFFEKRDCLLPILIFTEIVQLSWDRIWPILKLITKYAFNEQLRPFRRNQAMNLLITFYTKNQRLLLNQTDKINSNRVKFEKEFTTEATNWLKDGSEENCKSNDKLIILLLKLLKCVHLFYKQHSKSFEDRDQICSINWQQIEIAFQNRNNLSPTVKNVYNNLARTIGISEIGTSKEIISNLIEKNEENEEQEATAESEECNENEEKIRQNTVKKKHKRKNKNTLHLKKQAKLLRNEAMENGLEEGVSFNKLSGIKDTNIEDQKSLSNKNDKRKRKYKSESNHSALQSHSLKKKKK